MKSCLGSFMCAVSAMGWAYADKPACDHDGAALLQHVVHTVGDSEGLTNPKDIWGMSPLSCGNGMSVSADSDAQSTKCPFNAKVEGIKGDWMTGCLACGQYLGKNYQDQLDGCNWYCEQVSGGVWLKSNRGVCQESGSAGPPMMIDAKNANDVKELSCSSGAYQTGKTGIHLNNKVMNIVGSWETGCEACGNYLLGPSTTQCPWSCASTGSGVWLKSP